MIFDIIYSKEMMRLTGFKGVDLKTAINNWDILRIDELKNRNLKFVFNDEELPESNKNKYNVSDSEARFCLYDDVMKETILVIDFFQTSEWRVSLSPEPEKFLNSVKLELLEVPIPELRCKGIATYYYKKFQELLLEHGLDKINMVVNPKAKYFKNRDMKNSLSKEELMIYYEKHSLEGMTINFL